MTHSNLYKNLPETPGVYLMKNRHGDVLYVGKAGNLRRRVASYFVRPHDSRIQKLVSEVSQVQHKKTDTAIEALILEAELIKKLSPPWNVREKDDKSFLYVEVTKEKFPRVLLVRGREKSGGMRFGPFTSAHDIRVALQIIRRIFPWSVHPPLMYKWGTRPNLRPCFDYEIGLCPGTCAGLVSREEYMRNIRNLKLFFEGKKARILGSLRKEMAAAAKHLEFEKAEKLKRRMFALEHVEDVALLGEDHLAAKGERWLRIEGYDISNISGTSAVGSMVVFTRSAGRGQESGEPDRNEYRKFKIRTVTGSDDVGMLREVIKRRLKNSWPLPDLMLVDGGRAQVNAAKMVLDETGLKIPVVGMAKGPKRKKTQIVGKLPPGISKKTLVRVRDEAHRFAIAYHKKLRSVRSFE